VTSSGTVPNGTSSGSPVGNEGDTPSDVPTDLEGAVLELNNAHAAELSFLELHRLRRLLHQAFYARSIGSVEAFLLALDERADYDSPNYGVVQRGVTRAAGLTTPRRMMAPWFL